MHTSNLSQLIRSRRSIYPPMYNDQPIERATIMQVLENANWAPTHKKTEPWRFQVFQGKALKELSNYLGDYYRDHTPAELFSESKYKRTVAKALKSGCVIAICMHLDPTVNIPEWEEVSAVACAVQNMWLTCTSLGIGAYWSSPKSIIDARSFLNLSADQKCLGLFYMGYTDAADLTAKRGDVADKIVWR